jgi:Beta-lactamase enzyme family
LPIVSVARLHRFARHAVVMAALAAAAPAVLSATASAAARHSSSGACTISTAPAGTPAPTFLGQICAYLSGRRGVVQAAIYNRETGASYLVSDGADKQLTGSIAKVDILAQWLHSYQRSRTRIPGGIPYSIQYVMQSMIEMSDNAAATALFYFHGGCTTLTRFNDTVPMSMTKVGCQTRTYYGWGNTTTTAADQVALWKLFAYGGQNNVLGPPARRYALSLLQSVEPGQNWGVSCGPWSCSRAGGTIDNPVRPGTNPVPGTIVAQKNGWKTLPTCRRPIPKCPWQVNSTGWVRGQGRDYAIAVLTTDDPVGTGNVYGFNYGADTIQAISSLAWKSLE